MAVFPESARSVRGKAKVVTKQRDSQVDILLVTQLASQEDLPLVQYATYTNTMLLLVLFEFAMIVVLTRKSTEVRVWAVPSSVIYKVRKKPKYDTAIEPALFTCCSLTR